MLELILEENKEKNTLLTRLTKEEYKGQKSPFIIITTLKKNLDLEKKYEENTEEAELQFLIKRFNKVDSERSLYYLKPPQKNKNSILELAKLYTDEILKNSEFDGCNRFVLFAPFLLSGPIAHEMTKILEKEGLNISCVIFESDLNKILQLKSNEILTYNNYEPSEKINNLIIFSPKGETHKDKNLGWGKYSKTITVKTLEDSYEGYLSNSVLGTELVKSIYSEITGIEIIEILAIICCKINTASLALVKYTKDKEIENYFNQLLKPFKNALDEMQNCIANSYTPTEMNSPELPKLQNLSLDIWNVIVWIQNNHYLLNMAGQKSTEPLFTDKNSPIFLIEPTIEKIFSIYENYENPVNNIFTLKN